MSYPNIDPPSQFSTCVRPGNKNCWVTKFAKLVNPPDPDPMSGHYFDTWCPSITRTKAIKFQR